jgi:hypothetical protein
VQQGYFSLLTQAYFFAAREFAAVTEEEVNSASIELAVVSAVTSTAIVDLFSCLLISYCFSTCLDLMDHNLHRLHPNFCRHVSRRFYCGFFLFLYDLFGCWLVYLFLDVF